MVEIIHIKKIAWERLDSLKELSSVTGSSCETIFTELGIYLYMKDLLNPIEGILEDSPFLRSAFSRTISAILEDLGIVGEKPTSGPTHDTTQETSGGDSKSEEKCSEKESDS